MAPGALTTIALALQLLGGVDAEVAAGQLPAARLAQQDDLSMTLTVTPSLGFEVPSALGPRAMALYAPRFFVRYPNVLGVRRPALLHQASAMYRPVVRPDRSLTLDAGVRVGELDYTALSLVLGEQQVVAPEDPLIEILSLRGQAAWSQVLSPRWQWQLSTPVVYQKPLNDVGVAEMTRVGVASGAAHRVSRRLTWALGGGGEYVELGGADYLVAYVRSGGQWRVSRSHTAGLEVGVGRAQLLDSDADAPGDEAFFYPVAGAEWSTRRRTGRESYALNVDGRIDPVLRAIRPRATLALSTMERWTRQHATVATLTASTAVAEPPEAADVNETSVRANLALNWTQPNWLLRFGVRAGFRSPHLSEKFEIRERIAMVFLGVSWTPFRRND